MKKILMAATLFLAVVAANAQTVIEEVVIPSSSLGVDNLIVEIIQPDAQAITDGVPADALTYRFFVDMADGYKMITFGGADAATPPRTLDITSTDVFYNPANTGASGAAVNVGFWGFPGQAGLKYDTYAADGRVGSDLIGVPFSRDTDGTVDGLIAITPETTPAGDILIADVGQDYLTDQTIAAATFSDVNGGWAMGSVVGSDTENIAFVMQLTTAGELNVTCNARVQDEFGNSVSALDMVFPVAQDPKPEITWLLPANGSTVNKNEVVDLSVFAVDNNPGVSVEFFVNGVSVGTDNVGNGNTSNPSAPSHSVSWTALGDGDGVVDIWAVATDDASQDSTTTPIQLTVTDPNPTIVAVTAPADGDVLDLNDVLLTADASDADQNPLQSVEFTVNSISVGTDIDGTDGWSVNFNNIAAVLGASVGTPVNVIAIATNSDGEATASEAVSVTWANTNPTVTITDPATTPFDLFLDNDTTFVADAADADGSIASVAFYVNGSLEATDVTAPFEYTFISSTPADNIEVVAVATDLSGGQGSDTVFFNNRIPAGAGYAIFPITEYCSAPSNFCMPLVSTGDVVNVKGYDVEFVYDETKVVPTGYVIPGQDLVADRDWVSVTPLNQINDSTVRFSVYINSTAPTGTLFNGVSGDEVFCVEFSRLVTFGTEDVVRFNIPSLEVSFDSYVEDLTDGISGTYTTIKETEFNGSIAFWADNLPLNTDDLATEVTPAGAATPVVLVANDGTFSWDITDGEDINIVRDIDASESVMDVINGYDAFLTAKVTRDDENFMPTVYQIIAMDVNRDGRVSAGDITDISQRAVDQIDEFATDWLFVSNTTISSDLSFRISASYPANDALGYSRTAVPAVADDIALPIIDPLGCPVIDDESYKAILLGDIDGSYSSYAATASPVLKSAASDEESVSINLDNATLANGIVTLPVVVTTSANINAVDFSLDYSSALEFVSVVDYANVEETVNSIGSNVKLSSYSDNFINTEKAVFAVQFEASSIESTDLSFELAVIDGKEVDTKVTGSLQGITSIAGAKIENAVIYPNPSNDFINVKFNGVADVAIVNVTGQIMNIEKDVNGSTTFDVSELPAGNYTILVGGSAYNVIIVE